MALFIRHLLRSLGQRLLSAAVALPVLGVVVWAGTLWVAVVTALAAIWGLRELYPLFVAAGYRPIPWAGSLLAMGLLTVAALNSGVLVLLVLGGGIGLLLALALVRQGIRRGPGAWLTTVIGAVGLGLPLAMALLLRHRDDGMEWLLVGLFAVFATDTSAYAVGRLVGRRPMAPRISPGKTWEGAAGGFAGGVGATVGLVALLGLPFVAWATVALGAGIGVMAQVGDLGESRLKRLAGVKEAGALIPGHGGLLDRMDSLVLVFPLVYYVATVWPAA